MRQFKFMIPKAGFRDIASIASIASMPAMGAKAGVTDRTVAVPLTTQFRSLNLTVQNDRNDAKAVID